MRVCMGTRTEHLETFFPLLFRHDKVEHWGATSFNTCSTLETLKHCCRSEAQLEKYQCLICAYWAGNQGYFLSPPPTHTTKDLTVGV